MKFVTKNDVDLILGSDWADESKKDDSVFMANTWLGKLKFCKPLDPMPENIKQAGARLAKLASQGLLYVSTTDGTVTEKTVKAGDVSVSKKYADGSETGKSADMKLIDDLLKPFLCGGVGSINAWVCK